MTDFIVIIEKVSEHEVIVKCARCGGSGKQYGCYFGSPPSCSTCNGKGLLLLEIERLPLVKCARCHGTGEEDGCYSGAPPSCYSCGGAGCQPIAGKWKIIR